MPFLPPKPFHRKISWATSGDSQLKLLVHHFHDVLGVNPDSLGLAEVNEKPIVLRRANIPRLRKGILRAIVQPNGKGPKRPPFDQALDFLDFHKIIVMERPWELQAEASVNYPLSLLRLTVVKKSG
jgi:hypothetical protein